MEWKGWDKRAGSGRPIVTMVQSAEPVVRNDATQSYGANPAVRRSLPESEIRCGLRGSNKHTQRASLFPTGPEPLRKDQAELIERSDSWPGTLALEHSKLLPQSEVFEEKVPTKTENPEQGTS
jgi:hypothetical protein